MIRPSPWVEHYSTLLPAGGEVLDLACGNGRHARLLAEMGYRVCAVDRDALALDRLAGVPGITTSYVDLEGDVWPLVGRRFSGIVVTNYLWRARLPDLLALLLPGGVLIYETFMDGNAVYGKPSNPYFLLRPGELRAVAAAAGLLEIAYFEGYASEPKPCQRQAIVARRPI
ncbi:class I SAM-dependent methyltransferase [Azonexus sp.]|uniref:class I SAM-dependent methyltransferase n=1 Tax=Azonexus sp. TaxID=1872668 RepID=UPI0035B1B271